ncbi:MAG: hypothetical protein AAGA84_08935 [Pseudomonadota bacterium]
MKKTKVSDRYRVVVGDLQADQDDILRLWQLLPGDKPPGIAKLQRFYINTPAEQGRVMFLETVEDNRRVGVLCIGLRQFIKQGEPVSGVVFGDFAVEPAHRSLGPAIYFQKRFLELAEQEFDLTYGFPNALSSTVRVFGGQKLTGETVQFKLPLDVGRTLAKKIGLAGLSSVLGPLVNLIVRPIIGMRLGRALGGFSHHAVDDAFLDSLWRRVSETGAAMGVRNARTVRWRLQTVPRQPFELVAVVDADGEPAAYLAYETGRQDGVVRVVDHLSVSVDALRAAIAQLGQMQLRRGRVLEIKFNSHEQPRMSMAIALGMREMARTSYFVRISPRRRGELADDQPFRVSFFDNDA